MRPSSARQHTLIPAPLLALAALAALGLAALVSPSAARAQTAAGERPLLVFAAASLTNALDEIAAAYGAGAVKVSYGGSNALAKQIEAGAPADLFISADAVWMDYLANRGAIVPESRVDLLRNELVLIARAESAASVTIARGGTLDLIPLLGDGRLALADPDSVPAGLYAKAAFEALGAWRDLSPRTARAENVRAALAYVARGECPLGVVYLTDARIEPRVRVVASFPADLHPPIVYPAAVLRTGALAPAARFLAHLRAPQATATFEKYGFAKGQP